MIVVMLAQVVWPILIPKIGSERLRKLVPLGNGIISLVTQLWTGFSTAAAPSIAPAGYVEAGFFGSFGPAFLDILINSVLQTFLVTGAHSAAKNTREGLKR
jgi:hypothetical protein